MEGAKGDWDMYGKIVGKTSGRLVETGCWWIPRFFSVSVKVSVISSKMVFEKTHHLRLVPTKPHWQNVEGYHRIISWFWSNNYLMIVFTYQNSICGEFPIFHSSS